MVCNILETYQIINTCPTQVQPILDNKNKTFSQKVSKLYTALLYQFSDVGDAVHPK